MAKKERYNWWPFVLNMIRDYPARDRAFRELHRQSMSVNLSGMPGGGAASRTTEGIALRQLPPQEQREYDAVRKALARIRREKAYKERLEVVKLTLWRDFTIAGAAMRVHVADSTARRYRKQFIRLVGCMYGFMTEQEYEESLKEDDGRRKRKLDSHGQKSVL